MNLIVDALRRRFGEGARDDQPDARALRCLAGLLRAGATVRGALEGWSDEVQGVEMIARVSRRSRLGGDLIWCVSACEGEVARVLAALVAIHVRSGGDLAAMIDEVADAVDERDSAAGFARSQASGARVSARLVAWLPLASVVLVPGGAPSMDLRGLLLFATGAALCALGFEWMRRLLPVARETVDPAELAGLVCAATERAGSSFPLALEALARAPGTDHELQRLSRMVRLGCPWGRALASSSAGAYRDLGLLIRRSELLGIPPATELDTFVRGRRRARRIERETASRRAAVKMAVPLTVCILPAFLILAVGPHLTGVTT